LQRIGNLQSPIREPERVLVDDPIAFGHAYDTTEEIRISIPPDVGVHAIAKRIGAQTQGEIAEADRENEGSH